MFAILPKAVRRGHGKLFFSITPGLGYSFSYSTWELAYLLKQCQSLSQVRSIHQQFVVRGLLTSFLGGLIHSPLGGNILSRYVFFGGQAEAINVLEQFTPSAASHWWNLLITQDVKQGCLDQALRLYQRMHLLGAPPDCFTFPYVLKACGDGSFFHMGTCVHAIICKLGFESSIFACNALISMYVRCGALGEAVYVFNEVCARGIDDVASWNSVLAAYKQSGLMHVVLNTFRKMVFACHNGVVELLPDVISLLNVLPACASVFASKLGKEVHGFAIKNWLSSDLFIGNALVDMYAKCGMMNNALRVFNTMHVRDVISWNSMVTGYSQSGNFDRALEMFEGMQRENIMLDVVSWSSVISGYAQRNHAAAAVGTFRQMISSGSEPNSVTLISLLPACASMGALHMGKEIHCYSLRRPRIANDDMLKNALIDMYSKCKRLVAARTIYDAVPLGERDVVTWTAMIGGYSQHGDPNIALKLFSEMHLSCIYIKPNDFTISCVLIACARLSALHCGKQVHAFVIRHPFYSEEEFVCNSLLDMYSKCGDIKLAQKVFDLMPLKNDVSWTSLVTGYGMHGYGTEAITLFTRMKESGIAPDGIALLVVLYACNHSGMVDEGLKYFHSMHRDFGLDAGVEHYACVVDLLGRAGRIEEAKKLIEEMPIKPTMPVWVALLGACRIHRNLDIAEYASERISVLESENDGSYTLLSNVYANAQRWSDVARVRVLMKQNGVRKRPGCSWIQGKKGASTFTFFAGDRSHPQSQEIYALLSDLLERIKDIGYVPKIDFALHDVDDEEKSSLLMEHSEKLALAFGILTYPRRFPIRISKNLRVCGDCHSAFSYISKIIDNEIILRDTNRFHHFEKGSCSCGGYW